MLRAVDALVDMVSVELPPLVYAEATPALVGRVTDALLDRGLAAAGPETLLAHARDLGLTEAESVELTRDYPRLGARLLATLSAAGASPLPLTDLDRLVSAVVAAELELPAIGEAVAQAARDCGLVLKADLAGLDDFAAGPA